MHQTEHSIILFDGVCNLCSGAVQFVIRHDLKHNFHFASLQSGFGQQVLNEHQFPLQEFGSFILLENGKLYTKSTAALRVTRKLNRDGHYCMDSSSYLHLYAMQYMILCRAIATDGLGKKKPVGCLRLN